MNEIKLDIFSHLISRVGLAVAAIFLCCVFVTGPGFLAANLFRQTVGCVDQAQTPDASDWLKEKWNFDSVNRPDLPLNASMMAGLHNSYHQASPIGTVMATWGYGHPSLKDQLDKGVREIEIDIHFDAAGNFRVYHLKIFDQVRARVLGEVNGEGEGGLVPLSRPPLISTVLGNLVRLPRGVFHYGLQLVQRAHQSLPHIDMDRAQRI